MNANRNDDHGQEATPQDAVQGLVRATAEAMETFMTANVASDSEKSGANFNPLLTNPATMMAAATAIGLTMTGQWASAFLNAFQKAEVASEPDVKVAFSDTVESKEAVAPLDAAVLAETVADDVHEAAAPVATFVDDLKQISGVGPKLARVLTARGIVQFTQIADMDEAAATALDEELGLYGRILRDDWIGQAKAILAKKM